MTEKAELEALAVRLGEAAALPNGLYAEASTAIRALLAENKRLRAELMNARDEFGRMGDVLEHKGLRCEAENARTRLHLTRQALQETDNAG